MKNLIILIFAVLVSTINATAQTLIATTFNVDATANHNQRKIVRDANDNIYVVFTDYINQVSKIKGVMFDHSTGLWGDPFLIANGENPTLAISNDGKIHLIFQYSPVVPKIKYQSSVDFIHWTAPCMISNPDFDYECELPVADVDAEGRLNIFWVQRNENLMDSLVYACIAGDTLIERKCLLAKDQIFDIAIANHLQYGNNNLFFAIQSNLDSIHIFGSTDGMDSYHPLFATKGTQPCISYNTFWENEYSLAKLLFIDTDLHLTEVEVDVEIGAGDSNQLPCWFMIEYICIDDIAPPIGYSYLYMDAETLIHGFSYGPSWDWNTIMETITGNQIKNPSIAYKHFDFEYVDFIWTEKIEYGYGYNIYYKRDEKHIWLNIKEDDEAGKGFSITGFPNPFSEQLTLTISVDNENVLPLVQIYNCDAELIKTLDIEKIESKKYSTIWNGANETGNKVRAGMYVIICSVGDKRTVRKIIYEPK